MRKIVSFLIIFIMVVSISVLFKNVLNSYSTVEGLNKVRTEEKELEEEKASLEKELEERKSKEFIEIEARNKLGLSKKGESIYVTESNKVEEGPTQDSQSRELANWELWLEVFK